MAKKKKGRDPEGTARRGLAVAQEKLQAAQARRTRAVATGDHGVEMARQRAAARVDKATRQVEQRAQKVARAEARLKRLASGPRSDPQVRGADVSKVRISETAALGPDAAADHLEIASAVASTREDTETIVLASSMADAGFDPLLDPAMLRALKTLGDTGAERCSYSAWLASSQLSRDTFLRVRKRLSGLGLIARDGDGRGAIYHLTDAGVARLP